MFKRLFGAKDQPAVAHDAGHSGSAVKKTIDTIQKLSDNEEQLEKRKELLEKRMEAELEKAREFTKQKKKQQALMCLKRKKLLEAEMQNLDNMMMRVMEQRGMLEGQQTTVQVVSTIYDASQIAKSNMKNMNIDRVDKVIDEISEVNDQMRQLQEVMAQPTGAAADLDDEELMNELSELEATELDKELLGPAPIPQTKLPERVLPSVPQQAKAMPAKTKEEIELEALQAELA